VRYEDDGLAPPTDPCHLFGWTGVAPRDMFDFATMSLDDPDDPRDPAGPWCRQRGTGACDVRVLADRVGIVDESFRRLMRWKRGHPTKGVPMTDEMEDYMRAHGDLTREYDKAKQAALDEEMKKVVDLPWGGRGVEEEEEASLEDHDTSGPWDDALDPRDPATLERRLWALHSRRDPDPAESTLDPDTPMGALSARLAALYTNNPPRLFPRPPF